MKIRVLSTNGVARAVAREIAAAIAAKPALVLGLPTGRTPIPLYDELVRMHRRGDVDFAGVSTFNLDEFLGVPSGDPHSYCAFMRTHFFDRVNLPRRRIHFLNGAASDVARECARYERAIAEAGGIDLQILGLGTNGHIGFNEPADALIARTHGTRLTRATRVANAALFGGRASAVPSHALSMGVATILQARRLALMATGPEKARAVAKMIDGAVTPRLPASFLQLHARAEIWLDRAAAARLRTPVSRP